MKRYYVFTMLCLICWNTHGQEFYTSKEYGLSIGGSEYFGDLNDHYGFKYVRPCGGPFLRVHLTPHIAVRTTLSYAKVGYDDKWNTNDAFEQARNLNFRSDIIELSTQAEFNFFRFSTGELHSRFTPYLTGGVGVFYYDPYTYLNERKYFLRKQGTEGQNAGYDQRKYGPVSVCFPIGAGVKYWVNPGFNIGFEIADRLTLTDYLDDVSATYVGSDKFPNDPAAPNPAYYLQDRSGEVGTTPALGRAGKQRGSSNTKDQYLYMIFNISFQLKTYKCPNYLKGNVDDL